MDAGMGSASEAQLQLIANTINRAEQSNVSARAFIARSAPVPPNQGSSAITSLAGGETDVFRQTKYSRFTIVFDSAADQVFILVRDPASGETLFQMPSQPQPSLFKELIAKQRAEAEARATENNQRNAATPSSAGEDAKAGRKPAGAGGDAAPFSSQPAARPAARSPSRGGGVDTTA